MIRFRRYDIVIIRWDDIVNSNGEWLPDKGQIAPGDEEAWTSGIVWKVERTAITLIRDRMPYLKSIGAEIRIPRGVITWAQKLGRLGKVKDGWEFVPMKGRKDD